MDAPTALPDHLSRFGRPVPNNENSIEYLLDIINEYDESTSGLDPLVLYQREGIIPDSAAPKPLRSRHSIDDHDDEFDNSPLDHPRLASHFYKDFSVWLYHDLTGSTPRRTRTPSWTPARTPIEEEQLSELADNKVSKFVNSWIRELGVLSWRTFLNVVRTPELFLARENVTHTYIGEKSGKGVSGGERRRVSIGIDIIHNPLLLFLDEPTSGLDSANAYSVVEKVKDIARGGSIVMMTVHQPAYRIQLLLDRIAILARGRLIYMDAPTALPDHLSRFGRPVPNNENSIEYLLDIINEYDESTSGLDPLVLYQREGIIPDSAAPKPLRSRHSIDDHDDEFDNSPLDHPRLASHFYKDFSVWLYHDLTGSTPRRTRTPSWTPARTPIEEEQLSELADNKVSKFVNSWIRELGVLSWRTFLNVVRTPELFLAREEFELRSLHLKTRLVHIFVHFFCRSLIPFNHNIFLENIRTEFPTRVPFLQSSCVDDSRVKLSNLISSSIILSPISVSA
ncbi:ABC transporter G family member STR [Linum perenne]